MGGCHINNPCYNEIKPNDNYPIIVNYTINNSKISQDEPKVSNEEINIALPISPLSKISNKKSDKNKYIKNDYINSNEIKEENKKENNNNEIVNENNLKNNNANNLENKNLIYENLQIEEIISEEKIHTKNNHEVVFRGNLLLLSKTGEFEKMIIYCVMSRINLKLYKNINFFLKMKKPLFIIDLKLAKNIQIIKDNELGLCFSLLDKYIFNSQNKEQLFKWIVILNYFSNKLQN